jgi:hypothetical protein
MSRRIGARGALLASILVAPCLGAQSTQAYRRRLDSLEAIWRVARAEQIAADARRAGVVARDTVRVGPLSILADSEYVSLARASAAAVLPTLKQAFGRSTARLTRHPFVMRAERNDSGVVIRPGSAVTDSTGRLYLRSHDIAATDAMANVWRQKAEQVMDGELPPELRGWLRVVIPATPASQQTWIEARGYLVTAPSHAARECVTGDFSRCAQVLEVVPVDDPVMAYYDMAERRRLIEQARSLLRTADAALYESCTSAGTQTACDSLIRLIPTDAFPTPVQSPVRLSFLQYVLAAGGDGAYDRLVDTPGNVAARVAAAGRMPVDSLVAGWHQRVINAGGGSTTMTVQTALSALAWATLLGALALRSSRWRVA